MQSLIQLCLLTLAALAWVGNASPANPQHHRLERTGPMVAETGLSAQMANRKVAGVKGGSMSTSNRLTPRKGEYVCGRRLCKLRPREEPAGCDGICQYPI